jgi:hypothetical protein
MTPTELRLVSPMARDTASPPTWENQWGVSACFNVSHFKFNTGFSRDSIGVPTCCFTAHTRAGPTYRPPYDRDGSTKPASTTRRSA